MKYGGFLCRSSNRFHWLMWCSQMISAWVHGCDSLLICGSPDVHISRENSPVPVLEKTITCFFCCAKSLSHHLCFAVHVLLISQLEVSINGGTPKSSIYRWMFHYKPSSYWGTSIYWNPQFRIFTKTSWLPPNRWTQGVEGEHHCGCWERNDHRSLTRRSCGTSCLDVDLPCFWANMNI